MCHIIMYVFFVCIRAIKNFFDSVTQMIFYVIVLFWFVLFRRFTKQIRLGSNKILSDSVSLNFIDTVVIQIKDIIELKRLFHRRQINIS